VDVWDLAKLMGRRWYLTVPMLLLTVAGTVWTITTIKPDYTSTGTIILVPPADKTPLTTQELAKTNTWVELGEDVMAQAVTISVQTQATRTEIAADGLASATYEVSSEARSNLITVTGTAPTPEMAQRVVQRVMQQITTEVREQQAAFNPKPGRAITTQVLDEGDSIQVVTSATKRAAVVIAGIGLLLTAAVSIVCDVLLRRRERRRTERRAERRARAAADGAETERTVMFEPAAGKAAVPRARTGSSDASRDLKTTPAKAGSNGSNAGGGGGLSGIARAGAGADVRVGERTEAIVVRSGEAVQIGEAVRVGEAGANGSDGSGDATPRADDDKATSAAGVKVAFQPADGGSAEAAEPAGSALAPEVRERDGVERPARADEADDVTVILPLTSAPWVRDASGKSKLDLGSRDRSSRDRRGRDNGSRDQGDEARKR
jgi:capsular polysaccharide biosynthesis protein